MEALLKRSEELLEKAEADNIKVVEERDEFKDKYKRSLGKGAIDWLGSESLGTK